MILSGLEVAPPWIYSCGPVTVNSEKRQQQELNYFFRNIKKLMITTATLPLDKMETHDLLGWVSGPLRTQVRHPIHINLMDIQFSMMDWMVCRNRGGYHYEHDFQKATTLQWGQWTPPIMPPVTISFSKEIEQCQELGFFHASGDQDCPPNGPHIGLLI